MCNLDNKMTLCDKNSHCLENLVDFMARRQAPMFVEAEPGPSKQKDATPRAWSHTDSPSTKTEDIVFLVYTDPHYFLYAVSVCKFGSSGLAFRFVFAKMYNSSMKRQVIPYRACFWYDKPCCKGIPWCTWYSQQREFLYTINGLLISNT